MKNILFCGGSHLANAKSSIDKKYKKLNLDFYITAGPRNRQWSIDGGRYKVTGTLISGNGRAPEDSKDLSKYDHIIFVGQYIKLDKFLIFKKKAITYKTNFANNL